MNEDPSDLRSHLVLLKTLKCKMVIIFREINIEYCWVSVLEYGHQEK
jgi:hypothetical protein